MTGLLEHLRRYGKAYQLTAAACMGSIFYGWDIGLIGGVLTIHSFQSYFGVDKMSKSEAADFNGNVVSVLQGGCLCVAVVYSQTCMLNFSCSFGAIFTLYFSSKFGRKPTLIAAGIIYIVGSMLQSIVGLGSSARVAIRVLYFSRFVGGFGVGMVSAGVPCVPSPIPTPHIPELVPKVVRL
jgi:MFS family permease